MKTTDFINLFSNSNNSTGDCFYKPYPKTSDQMESANGRWNNPANNKANFMSSSPVSSCCQFSTGNRDWSGQGEDITTMVERMEKHKKIFTNNNTVQSTVSSPPNMWMNSSPNSSYGSSPQDSPFNSGYSSKSSRNEDNPFFVNGNSGFSQSNQSTFGSRTSNSVKNARDSFSQSSRFSTNSNYENDRLMQMD
eukprot:GFUD01034195.1.p1 GENE.GFUD01034195.1~~GFUD01034195.1.p1  ORF type:complete len:193 (-),score=34.46 GFUD01034195.1:463-1041(-)